MTCPGDTWLDSRWVTVCFGFCFRCTHAPGWPTMTSSPAAPSRVRVVLDAALAGLGRGSSRWFRQSACVGLPLPSFGVGTGDTRERLTAPSGAGGIHRRRRGGWCRRFFAIRVVISILFGIINSSDFTLMLVLVSCVFLERYPFLLTFRICWYRWCVTLSNGLPAVQETVRDALFPSGRDALQLLPFDPSGSVAYTGHFRLSILSIIFSSWSYHFLLSTWCFESCSFYNFLRGVFRSLTFCLVRKAPIQTRRPGPPAALRTLGSAAAGGHF